MTRAYEGLEPWRSVVGHLKEIVFETATGGALYFVEARTRNTSGDVAE